MNIHGLSIAMCCGQINSKIWFHSDFKSLKKIKLAHIELILLSICNIMIAKADLIQLKFFRQQLISYRALPYSFSFYLCLLSLALRPLLSCTALLFLLSVRLSVPVCLSVCERCEDAPPPSSIRTPFPLLQLQKKEKRKEITIFLCPRKKRFHSDFIV